MQRKLRDVGAGASTLGENLRREVQARGGRRNRTPMLREDGLIPFFVCIGRLPLYVRRQGCLTELFENFRDGARSAKPNNALTKFALLQNFAGQIVAETKLVTAADALAGSDQRPPLGFVLVQGTNQEDFYLSA